MSKKLLVVLFAGPDDPCKLQHALLFARDVAQRGGTAQVILEGAAPSWLAKFVQKPDAQARFFGQANSEGLIAGVCKGCARAHDALDASRELGLELLDGAFGHASLFEHIDDDYTIVSF